LLSTAYLDEAERCDEVVLLHDGRLLAQGTPAELRDTIRGRTFEITGHNLAKRQLLSKLSRAPGVLDGLIQGDRIRVVMEDKAPADLNILLPGVSGAMMKPVPPRFEDSFVALLKGKSGSENATPLSSTETIVPGFTHEVAGKKPVIEVHGLQRRFGDFYAVNDLNFSVAKGEVFGLLGANGAGKSTTFRMLCGLLPPSGGTLRVAGADLRNAAAAARARIGYMSQKFSLYGHLSVAENLRFFANVYGAGVHGSSGKKGINRIDWALQEFELASIAEFTSGDLSLGYKQRLALACALMHEPEILFLDEPTSGVDPLARREFWSRINMLAGKGVTVMVTTHFMEEAEYCDRLAIMAAGEILTMGTPAKIKEQSRTEDMPEPTMEDAFVALIRAHEQGGVAA